MASRRCKFCSSFAENGEYCSDACLEAADAAAMRIRNRGKYFAPLDIAGTELQVCHACGTVVRNWEDHLAWHNSLARDDA